MGDVSDFPTTSNELIFPSASRNISNTVSSLCQSTLSPHNRLRSILQDSLFVRNVASTHKLPLIANERCGSWYIPPSLKAGSVYFKSTDGHTGQWAFSTRRLNLHLLDIIGEHGGCIVVDSTRRGKSMPDALSKTIPIWCAVINRLLFEQGNVLLPKKIAQTSEGAQISEKLDAWAEDAKKLRLDLESLRKKLNKPLRPVWIAPRMLQALTIDVLESCFPVICCTASERITDWETAADGYVQGAADDSESWAQGLTHELFWQYKKVLLSTTEQDLAGVVKQLKANARGPPAQKATLIKPTRKIYIGTLQTVDTASFDGIIMCSDIEANATQKPEHDIAAVSNGRRRKLLELKCGSGKLGSRALRTQLGKVPSFIAEVSNKTEAPNLLLACITGKDLSAGVALAVLCLYYDDEGTFHLNLPTTRTAPICKDLIRRRLTWITTSEPSINPSGATLQTVNAFLMPRP